MNQPGSRASNLAMKLTSPSLFCLSILTVLSLGLNSSPAQTPVEAQKDSKPGQSSITEAKAASTSQKPLPSDPEERFKAVFTKATLSGRWAALKDGALGEERTGDKYNIVSAVKGEGDAWIISAKMKYGDREFVMPIPVKMRFTGDVAILTVDNLQIPNGGTYTARLLIYERTYSGTWKGQRGGGMLYGTITNEE
jgi:hypothetical protein